MGILVKFGALFLFRKLSTGEIKETSWDYNFTSVGLSYIVCFFFKL